MRPPLAESPLERILARLAEGVKPCSNGFMARCPCHEDRQASLSIQTGEDGRVLLHCFAGCDTRDIVHSLELTMGDLFLSRESAVKPSPDRLYRTEEMADWPWTQNLYVYTDPFGTPLYLVLKVLKGKKKSFVQYRAAGMGQWRKGLGDVAPTLYRLPELTEALRSGRTIYIPEGEKDVENLRKLGLEATCNSGGAGKWREGYSKILAGADVVVLPDNDEPGRKHALSIAESLCRAGSRVRLIDLPGLPEKGDVSDWFKAGWTRTDLERLVEESQPWRPAAPLPEQVRGPEEHLSDLGNTRRLVRRHGHELRYCHPWAKWLVWDGTRWRPDDTAEVMRRAKETVSSLYEEAARSPDDEARRRLGAHALKSESEARLRSMISLAASEIPIPILPDELDRDPMRLNCLNGTLNLTTGRILAHRQEDLITKRVLVAYDPEAVCPNWLSLLRRAMGNNDELISFLQRAVGYALTGDIREQCFFILYGTGSNGKSTFLNTLCNLLGDYSVQAPADTFLARRGEAIPNDVARLRGARFVAASEVEEGRRLSEVLVKQLTGGDRIAARFLHQDYFEFQPQFKLFMAVNHKPIVRGTDHAIWRRIRLIPWTVTIPPEEQDRQLASKLLQELPGILTWAVRGCLAWQREGISPPSDVREATADYQVEMDPLTDFLAARCELSPHVRSTAHELFGAYTQWCETNGEPSLSQKGFGMKLTERGLERRRGAGGAHSWIGIGLRPIV